jgi:hypothetical protein
MSTKMMDMASQQPPPHAQQPPAHVDRADDVFGPRDDAMLHDLGAAEPFEIHRRSWLFVVLVVLAWGVAGAYAWYALERADPQLQPWLWGVVGVLALVGLSFAWMLRQVRTPVFVADLHGVRMLGETGWVGFLWREMGEVSIDRRRLLRGPQVRVRGGDDADDHTISLGLATNVSAPRAEIELARRRDAASY